MKKSFAILVFWLLCGYLNWGLTLGYFSHKYPYMDNVAAAALFAVGGPTATIPLLILTSAHWYWQVRPTATEERWKIFHREFPNLSRSYFEQALN